MGGRAIVLLLLVAGALAAVLLWTDQKPPAKVAAEVSVLDGRSLREADRIWWQFTGLAPIEVVRRPDGFALTEPLQDAASPAYLQQICVAFDSAQMRATPLTDDEAGRERAGLSPPQLRFVAAWPDGKRIELDVGDAGPLGTTQFLRRDGRIWEGGNGLLESLRVGVDDLRDRSVFRNQANTVTELRVEQPTATGEREVLHLVQKADEWWLQQPMETRADGPTAMRFLGAVLSLRVTDFPPGIMRTPAEAPAIVVTARGLAGEETVQLWLERGQVYGQLPDRGVLFASDNRQYSQVFENAAEQLRARILVPLGDVYTRLGSVLVDPGQGSEQKRVRIARDSATSDWRLVEPVEHAAAPTPCQETAQAINNLHAVEFVKADDGGRPAAADPRYGLGPGRLQVAVQALGSSRTIELWFGDRVRKNDLDLVHACRADEPRSVVLVPEQAVAQLRRPWTAYVTREFVRLGVQVGRLDLQRRTGESRTFRLQDGHWIRDDAEGRFDDVGSFANDVLRDLDGRTAVDVTGEEFAVADWTLTLARASGDALLRLRVWDRGPDQPLVLQKGDGPVGYEIAPIHDKQLRELWR